MTDHPLKAHIAEIPDFPAPGVLFRDISPLLRDRFPQTMDAMAGLFTDAEVGGIDAVAGMDARGFVFAGALAQRWGKGLVMIRKSGKLPPPVVGASYALEYAASHMEVQPGSGRVLLVDDLVATGGTLTAAADLLTEAGYAVAAIAALIDLTFLNDFAWRGMRARSVVQYDA
ncbi:MAG TPA: adenine phosphoribosyltransferase [Rhodospirillaceae bacterium]|jgi:adenine phosphoribosyltransferase|nr:adenine phosphoribosyltransferase [Alphaproteobacteria bacterium]HBH25896.1 adenine phosphoribosyltransferase [Rhodospirillaceae bacterium]